MGNFFIALCRGLAQFIVIIATAVIQGVTNTIAAILRSRFGLGLVLFIVGWQIWAVGKQDVGLTLGLIGIGLMLWSAVR